MCFLMTRESRAAVIVGEASTMIVRPVPVTCSCNGTCNKMGGALTLAPTSNRPKEIWGAIAQEKVLAQGAGPRGASEVRRTSGERVFPSSTSAPFLLGVR